MKIILFGFLFISGIAGLGYWFVDDTFDVDMEPVVKDYIIEFKSLDEKIYVSSRAWGVSGNHQEIVLSSTPISPKHREYSKNDNYIFYTSEIYYKKEGGDKLIVFAPNSSVSEPKGFNSSIHIILKDLRTADELKNYENNYKKYGLEKISILDK